MKRGLSAALLSLVMLLLLWPATAAAAEPDEIVDSSDLDHFEIPLIEPRFPLSDQTLAPKTDKAVDASELEHFELPVMDPRFPPASAIAVEENDPDAVQLSDVHAVRYIDRLELPQFALDFYETLERETKAGGVFVDPSKSTQTVTYQTDIGLADAYVLSVSYPSETELNRLGFHFDSLTRYVNNCMWAAFQSFHNDHPEVFWMSGYSSSNNSTEHIFSLVLGSVDGRLPDWDIRVDEYRNTAQLQRAIANLESSANAIVNAVSGKSNYEKIAYFNEWLTTNNQYNYNVAYTGDEASHSVYRSIGALTTNDGQCGGRTGTSGPVCEGYSRAFQLLCQKAGIPCVVAGGVGHSWNYVQPDAGDARWYGMDVTWNDPIMNGRPSVSEYLNWGGTEQTAYTLVGADTIVYDQDTNTFSESHPVENQISGISGSVLGPALNELAYVDHAAVRNLDAPAQGAVPDTSVTLASEPKDSHHPSQAGVQEIFINPTVTWSPTPSGTFAADTVYTATITYTPRRQGYRLTPADASKITVAGAQSVTVREDGAIQAVFGSRTVQAKADEFTCRLPENLMYDGQSKTAAVRSSISSSIHNGYFTLAFTDSQHNAVSDLVKPGTYSVSARIAAHGQYAATEVSLGSVTIRESSGLHGKVTLSFDDSSTQARNGTAYVVSNAGITVNVSPDPGYKLDRLQVIRDDNGQPVSFTGSGNAYTFRMPAADVSIRASFVAA